MCGSCDPDAEYFHSAECVYDYLVKEYPVLWLRDSTLIGATYLSRELLSPEGIVLAIRNKPPDKGWYLRRYYNDAIDEELDPLRGDCIELADKYDAFNAFLRFTT